MKSGNLFLMLLFILIFASNASFTLSQDGNPQNFNESLKVSTGDTARYDIIKGNFLK